MSEVAQPSCPPEEALAEFAGGAATGAEGEAIEAHLDGCADCSWLLSQLLGDREGQAAGADRELRAAAPPSYRLHELLGAGGMGTVFEAEDLRLGRRVALKLLREETVGRAGRGARFLREARITALLEHPNIVPVLEVGELEDGAPYYTQRLVRGRTLARAIAGCKDLRERLALLPHFRDLCNAVAYAHQQGVIHRDLKPSNVLCGPFGETVVVDWGLARRRDAPPEPVEKTPFPAIPGLTQDGQAIGTPGYMSPEQAAGQTELVDARSDVFGLGAVLFEILMGRAPYASRSDEEALRKAIEGPPPAADAAGVPPDLAAIAAKALSRDRHRRYADAAEMKADVEAFSEGRLVTAYRYNAAQIAVRFAARHRALTAGLLVALLLGGGWLGNALGRRAEQPRQLSDELVTRAYRYTRAQQWDRAGTYFALARVAMESVAARWGLAFIGATGAEPLYKLRGASAMRAVAFAPSGKLFATAGDDGVVHLIETATGHERTSVNAGAPALGLAFASEEKIAFAAGSAIFLWEPGALRPPQRIDAGGGAVAFALQPAGSRAAVALADRIDLYDLATGRPLASLRVPAAVGTLAILPSGEVFFAGPAIGGMQRWDPSRPAAELIGSREDRPRKISACSQAKLLVLDEIGSANLWAIAGGRIAESVQLQTGVACTDGALSADCGTAVCIGDVGNIRLWDSETRATFVSLAGSYRSVLGVALSADGDLLAVGSADRALRLSSLHRARPQIGRTGAGREPVGLVWPGGRERLYTLDRNGTVGIWSGAEGTLSRTFTAHPGGARALSASFDGALLATAGEDGVRLWDGDGRAIGSPTGASCSTVALSPSGAFFAAGTDRGALLIGPPAATDSLPAHDGEVWALAFSPDENRLASAGKDGAVLLWDPRARRLIARLEGHEDLVRALAFSPDGKTLASGSVDRTVRLWSAIDGRDLGSLRGDSTGEIASLAWAPRSPGAPASGLLMALSHPATADLWDVAAGTNLLSTGTWPTSWMHAAFSPDARRVALLRSNGVLQLRDLTGTERLRAPAVELEAMLKLYKYRATALDLERDEEALRPPASR